MLTLSPPCEDTGRRPSAKQEVGPHRGMDLLALRSGTFQLPVSTAHMVPPFQLPEQTQTDPSLRGRGESYG